MHQVINIYRYYKSRTDLFSMRDDIITKLNYLIMYYIIIKINYKCLKKKIYSSYKFISYFPPTHHYSYVTILLNRLL